MTNHDAGAVTFPNSIFETLRNLSAIFWKPSEVFGKLRDNPQYLIPLIVVALGGILLQLETRPLIEQLLIRTAPKDLPPDQLERGLIYFRRANLIGMLVSPALMFLKWACMSWLIFLATVIVGGRGYYGQTLSLVSFSSVILLFESWYSRLVVHLKGIDALTSPRDLDPPIGLSLITPDLGPGWFTFLNTFNLFEMWFVILLVLGLSKIENISKKRAALAIVPIWMLWTGLCAGFAALAGNGQ
jgi:hypothetical protein